MSHPIPDAALDRHVGILGKTGSGKSNAAKTVAEELMLSGARTCVIDPTGTWWGMRLKRDGKTKSKFEPVIFGGNHADLPISAEHGAAIAEAIGTSSTSAIIDTRLMTVGKRTKFFADFAEALLRSNQGPLHLIIDEAHLFAPQGRVSDPQSGKMVHAANNLVSLGRGIGLKIILISQRPAKLHKDSLTQVETLVAMRLIAPQDRKAIDDWVGEWADPGKGKEISRGLPSMKTGDAWIWSPELDVLKQDHFPLASTFDSGSSSNQSQAAVQAIDLDAMTERLETIKSEVVANDPARLRREIADLKRAAKTPQQPNAQALNDAETAGYNKGLATGENIGFRSGYAQALHAAHQSLTSLEHQDALARNEQQAKPMIDAKQAKKSPHTAPAKSAVITETTELGAERKPLSFLCASYPAGYTEPQWAVLSGYKRTGGTWGTYKSRLRSRSFVEERGGKWFATTEGLAANGNEVPEVPHTSEGRLNMWKSKIPGVGPMLQSLYENYPRQISRDDLACEISMTASGGSFGTYLSRLRANGLIEEPERGFYRLGAIVMEETT